MPETGDRNQMQDGGTLPDAFPVAVLLRFRETPDNPWQDGSWSVEGVVVTEAGAGSDPGRSEQEPVHTSAGSRLYLSGGFRLELYPDEAESYYQNLMAERPAAFVLCDRLEDGRIQPRHVTLSYAEGTSFMEVEEEVYSVPLAPELHRWLEQYVLEHYVPEKKKKRKRDNWKDETGSAPPPHLRQPGRS
jgi:hypothetical protein